MTENFIERIDDALNDIKNMQMLFKQRYGEECPADKEIEEILKAAKSEHEILEQYRAIGTVEECREARERQRTKKPRFYAHNYYCGNCGNLVGNSEFNWKRFMYCDRCGNPVDWSE